MEDKKAKKQFYQDYINEIERGNWRAELSIKTLEHIREGIRMEFDRIEDKIKGIDEEIERKMTELKLPLDKIEEIKTTKSSIEDDPEKLKYLNPESQAKHKDDIRRDTKIKRENKIVGWGGTDTKIITELGELFEVRDRFQLDADVMQEQMMGKFIETEGEYKGGLDEEIKSIKGKIIGGEEFKALINRELKKL